MTTRQDGGFPPVARRHYSTGSSQIPTELLQSINPYPMSYQNPIDNQFYAFAMPTTIEPRPRSMSSSRLPPKKPRATHRKMSMNESAMSMNNGDAFATSWSSVPSLVPGSFEEEMSPMTPALGLHDDTYKKQRRRECHNQVEKRRREHINARIEELSTLLPPHYKNIEEEDEEKRSKNKDSTHCKGTILSNSVQYIHELQSNNALLYSRIAQLEAAMATTWPTFPLQQMERSPEPDWRGYIQPMMPVNDSAITDSSPDQNSPFEDELNLGMQTW